MEQNNELKLFEDKKIRAKWDDEQEKWYFSVVDIVSALTDNDYQAGRKYWKTLKMRLNKEGSELVTNCYQLKMEAYDGKYIEKMIFRRMDKSKIKNNRYKKRIYR